MQARRENIEAWRSRFVAGWNRFEDAFFDAAEAIVRWIGKYTGKLVPFTNVVRTLVVIVSLIAAALLGLAVTSDAATATNIYLLYVPAVMLAALFGGFGAGLAAMLVGAVLGNIMLARRGDADATQLIFYLMVSAIILGLCRVQEEQRKTIERHAENLQDRIEERSSEMERAHRELEDFTHSISHDLRGPMRHIVATSQFLQEDLADRINEEERKQLVSIGNSANRLSELVDSLLTYARLATIPMKPKWVNLTQIADDVAEAIRKDLDGRMIMFDVQPNLIVTGDEALVRMVVRDLFENACKYADPNRSTVIRLYEQRRKSGPVYCVEDNGIGFDMEYVEKIFMPFQKLHRDVEYAGTGIGLANARRIIERHGGRIWAVGKPGEGSTFYFTLNPQISGKARRSTQAEMQ